VRVSFYFISETGCLLNANVCRTLYIEHQLSGLFAAMCDSVRSLSGRPGNRRVLSQWHSPCESMKHRSQTATFITNRSIGPCWD